MRNEDVNSEAGQGMDDGFQGQTLNLTASKLAARKDIAGFKAEAQKEQYPLLQSEKESTVIMCMCLCFTDS